MPITLELRWPAWFFLATTALAVCLCGGALAWAKPPLTELDDKPEKFVPVRPATERQRNEEEALTLYAAGLTEEQKGNLALALRLYHKALRYDPNAVSIVRQVVDVATRLNRTKEVMRYKIRALELDPSNELDVLRVAEDIIKDGEVSTALRLCEQAREAQDDKKTFVYLALTYQVGQYRVLAGRTKPAAEALGEVLDALSHPDQFKLGSAERKALEGKRGESYELIGAVMLLAERPDEALLAFEAAQKIKPRPDRLLLRQAQVLAAKRQPAEALEKLDEYFATKDTSEQTAPYELLAEVLKDLKRDNELIERLEKLRTTLPSHAPLDLYLARKYLLADQLDQAEKLLAKLQKTAPTSEGYRRLLEVYRRAGKFEPLLMTLVQVREKTNSLDAVEDEVKKLADNQAALDELIRLAKQEPDDAGRDTSYTRLLVVAHLALEAKRYQLGSELYELAIKNRPRQRDAWVEACLGLLRLEQYDAAIDLLRRGIEEKVLATDNPDFHLFLSIALEMSGQTDEALKAAKQAAEIGEHVPRVESRVAWVLYHAKRYDAAAEAYRQLVARFENNYTSEGIRRAVREARLALSNVYVSLHKLREAEDCLEEVLDEYPEDIAAMNDLGYLLADQGKQLDRAVEMAQKAVAAEPENYAYRDSLGWAYFKLGRFDEALAEIKIAANEKEPDGVVLDHLGDVYLALKQPAEAEQAWKRAVELLKKQADQERVRRVTEKLSRLPK
ncbi:MAG: tetratricopeptide repeat protein [Planctomycetes bacterium]|nr:tetratricopeptide repeat protein [Planctomycetota bacterium]